MVLIVAALNRPMEEDWTAIILSLFLFLFFLAVTTKEAA